MTQNLSNILNLILILSNTQDLIVLLLIRNYTFWINCNDWSMKIILGPYLWPKMQVFLDKSFKKLLPYLKSVVSNLSRCKVSFKTKNFKFKTKILPYLGNLGGDLKNNHCLIWSKHMRTCQNAKSLQNKKHHNLGPNIPYLCVFEM